MLDPASSHPEGSAQPPGSRVAELPLVRVVLAILVGLILLVALVPGCLESAWSPVWVSLVLFGIPSIGWLTFAVLHHYSVRDVMGEGLRRQHLPLAFRASLALPAVGLGLIGGLMLADLVPESWKRAAEPSPPAVEFISLLIGTTIGPCVEELFFRGLLFRRLLRAMRPMHAALISSLLFGLLHYDTLGSTLFGLAMGVLYARTSSLWVPVMVHALNNFLASLPSLVAWAVGVSVPDNAWLMAALLPLGLPWVVWLLYAGRHDIAAQRRAPA